MTLERIVFLEQPKDLERIGEACPQCGTPTIWHRMPCPEGRLGCLTDHWGWQCPSCLTFYKKKKIKAV